MSSMLADSLTGLSRTAAPSITPRATSPSWRDFVKDSPPDIKSTGESTELSSRNAALAERDTETHYEYKRRTEIY